MTEEIKVSATAQVRFIVEMPAGSSWGTTCPVDQIFRQAGRETASKLSQIIREHGGKIIGEPEVIAVLCNRK